MIAAGDATRECRAGRWNTAQQDMLDANLAKALSVSSKKKKGK
jgi:hypothetical protein